MKGLKKQLLDFIPVFLGVVLALFFNNLNESRVQQQQIDGLLKKIALGTEKNIKNLTIQLNQNERVMDTANYYLEDPAMSIGAMRSAARGIRYIQFDLAAWNVLKSSELLVDVDYELVSLLYLLNEHINNSNEIISEGAATDRASKEAFISDLSDYILEIKHQLFLSEKIRDLLSEKPD